MSNKIKYHPCFFVFKFCNGSMKNSSTNFNFFLLHIMISFFTYALSFKRWLVILCLNNQHNRTIEKKEKTSTTERVGRNEASYFLARDIEHHGTNRRIPRKVKLYLVSSLMVVPSEVAGRPEETTRFTINSR